MKKIVILALHLGTGGIENVIANVSNILVKKYSVEIISTYKINKKPSFYIDPNVKITYLMENIKPNKEEFKKAVKSKNIFKVIKEGIYALKVLVLRKKEMIKAVKNVNADVIISTRDFHNSILAKYAKKGIVKISQEHNYHNNDEKYINKIINSVRGIDYFMPVSVELTNFYKSRLKDNNTKCVYIPNAIDKKSAEISKLKGKNILSVGRLSKEKGFLDLVDVFKIINDKDSNVHLTIAGDGDQKQVLKKKIKELNLEKNITLLGFLDKSTLEKQYIDSDVYAMTSYTESFGLVLVEAESFGLPIVAMDSAKGAIQIVKNNVNGIIIKNRDKEKMANEILKVLKDKELKIRLSKEGVKMSKEYTVEEVSKNWYNFIEKITN